MNGLKSFGRYPTSGTGGRLCSPNLRFWRPALSIELHPYIYRHLDGMLRVLSGFPGACGVHSSAPTPEQAKQESHLSRGFSLGAAWRARPSGPDSGLMRACGICPQGRSRRTTTTPGLGRRKRRKGWEMGILSHTSHFRIDFHIDSSKKRNFQIFL